MSDFIRKKMIAKVHIAVRDLKICTNCKTYTYWRWCLQCGFAVRNITDEDYRAFLKRYTGKTSCKQMSIAELDVVLQVLRSIGFIDTKKINITNTHNHAMAKKLEEKAMQTLGKNWKKRLRGYIKKAFGVDSVMFLTERQIIKVYGFLRKEDKYA